MSKNKHNLRVGDTLWYTESGLRWEDQTKPGRSVKISRIGSRWITTGEYAWERLQFDIDTLLEKPDFSGSSRGRCYLSEAHCKDHELAMTHWRLFQSAVRDGTPSGAMSGEDLVLYLNQVRDRLGL